MGSEHGVGFRNYPNQDQGEVEVHLNSALLPHIIHQNVATIYKFDLEFLYLTVSETVNQCYHF